MGVGCGVVEVEVADATGGGVLVAEATTGGVLVAVPGTEVRVAVLATDVLVAVLGTEVRVGVLATGVTLPHDPARIATSSIHQPVAETELSLASLKRIDRFWPAKAANDTLVSTKLVPLGLLVQACLPAIGLWKPEEMVSLYPLVRIAAPASAHVPPPLVENSSTPPSNVSSRSHLCQKLRVAPGGTAIALTVVRYWSDMLLRSGANAE